MSRRIVGVASESGKEIAIGGDHVLLTSADSHALTHQLHLEHVVYDCVDNPEMTIRDPYVALVLGEPLAHWRQNGYWRTHKFRPGQLSVKSDGGFGPFQSADACEVVIVSIRSSFISQLAGQIGLPSHVVLADDMVADNEFLRASVLALRDEVSTAYSSGSMFFESLQTALGTYLLTHYGSCANKQASERRNAGGLNQQTLKRVTDYMMENLSSDISLSELANLSYLSTYHFSRLFKRSTGYSPYTYLTRLRVSKAADLLRKGIGDLSHIARATGFHDSRSLNRQFKRILGQGALSYIKHFE